MADWPTNKAKATGRTARHRAKKRRAKRADTTTYPATTTESK